MATVLQAQRCPAWSDRAPGMQISLVAQRKWTSHCSLGMSAILANSQGSASMSDAHEQCPVRPG